jgi:hypothetical protein
MGKGTELDELQEQRQAEIARGEREDPHRNDRPIVHLRTDTPSIKVTDSTAIGDVLRHVRPDNYGVALRDPKGEVQAIMVPLERYIEMASATISGDDHLELAPGGPSSDPERPRIQARPASLHALHIEQVDPQAEWLPGAEPTQHLGRTAVPREPRS